MRAIFLAAITSFSSAFWRRHCWGSGGRWSTKFGQPKQLLRQKLARRFGPPLSVKPGELYRRRLRSAP